MRAIGVGWPGGADAGVYLLVLELAAPWCGRVGRLGAVHLPAGWYVYVGSARRSLRARVRRHLRRCKPRRWHVDWLTTAPSVYARSALLVTDGTAECALARRVAALPGAAAPVPGFGASDCRSGCPAHLFRFAHPVRPETALAGPPAAVLRPGPRGPS